MENQDFGSCNGLASNVIELMFRNQFFKHKLSVDLSEMAASLAESYHDGFHHRYIPIFGDCVTKVKAHIARFQIEPRAWLCHHWVADPGHGGKVLKRLAEGLVTDFNEIDYVYGYYRKDNKTPDQVFGDIVRAGDPEVCREKEYGYILPESRLFVLDDIDNLAADTCYCPSMLRYIPERSYRNCFFNTESFHASTHSGQYIGILTKRRSIPWLNASNLLNCDIWDIDETSKTVFSYNHFNPYGNIDHPILWNPIRRMNQKPEKVYMEWRIKMDERSFKYFNIKK